jgi:anti-sigma regulatory factor (Ser/Thr protein kinase)
MAGETESGDACATISRPKGPMVAVADGLGHGARAAEAAAAFVASVREAPDLALDEVFARAHRALLKTRGAVAAVARFDEARNEVEIAGIGNVAVMVSRSADRRTEHAVVTPGVLGSAYRAARLQTLSFALGDVLVMHTDGVRSRFDFGLLRAMPVQAAAESLVRTNAKGSDDAACVVVRGVLATVPAVQVPASPPPPGPAPGDRMVPVRIRGDAECVAETARAFAKELGFGPRAQWEVSISASELATNILKFAGEGEIHLRYATAPRAAIVVEAVDRGRGIADVASAVVDGFSEGAPLGGDRPRRDGQGLGVGLGSVHRLMDKVEISTDHGRGTRVVAWKHRPAASV